MSENNNTVVLAGLERRLLTVSEWFAVGSAVALFGMMALTAVDVTGRFVFSKPLFGAYELIGMLLVVAGPFGMAITQMERKHINISLVVDMLSPYVQKIFTSVGLFFDIAIYSMITVGMYILTAKYYSRGDEAVSSDLAINLGWISILFAFAGTLFLIVLIVHFIQSLYALKEKE